MPLARAYPEVCRGGWVEPCTSITTSSKVSIPSAISNKMARPTSSCMAGSLAAPAVVLHCRCS